MSRTMSGDGMFVFLCLVAYGKQCAVFWNLTQAQRTPGWRRAGGSEGGSVYPPELTTPKNTTP